MAMWTRLCFAAGLLAAFPNGSTATPFWKRAPTDADLATTALANAYKILDGTLQDGSTHTKCTKDNVVIRKEFGDMTKDERVDYTRAVNCLLTSPSKLKAGQYPGAKNRYDDFVVVHMNMTPTVHVTANFLHWHRYLLFAYETALRTECGYKSYQPYWNWGKYPDPTTSPVFNGDAYSMGGNGEYIAGRKGQALGMAMQQVPAGKGGGCVKTGPFANMTVNLGPVFVTIDAKIPANPRSDGYGYNPRCLRRDVNDYFTKNAISSTDIANHINANTDLGKFQDTLQADTTRKFSPHTAGHYSIWGDPGGDFYVSPAEPAFWLHHGMIDRHWWVWQNQDPKTRTQQYTGVTQWMVPNSPKGKITDINYLDVVTPAGMGGQPSSALVSSLAGPFCYVYA